jgi:hypothetical protein
MKIDRVHMETIASASDFYKWINANKEELGFDESEFHDNCLDNMFSEGNLSSRYSQDHCKNVINKEGASGSLDYWDKVRPYYPAILLFMEDYDLKTIRFECDW